MKRRRKILIVTCIVLGVVILIPVIYHYQLRFAVESYIAELKAKGEPMELAQVIPLSVPPEQNSADIFRIAASLFEEDKSLLQTNYIYKMRMVAPGKAMICWQQPDVRDYNMTNSWEDVSAAIAQNKKALELLRQIIERPALDFHIHYERGLGDTFDFTNLNLANLKKSAVYLSAAAASDLHNGDAASAVTNEMAMLALVDAVQNQRFVISELVRIAIVAIAQTVAWETLQSPHVTDGQLVALQNAWARLKFLQGYKDALAMEIVSGRITAAKLRSSNSDYLETWVRLGFPDSKETTLDELKVKTKIFLWQYWWSYPDQMRAIESYEIFMKTARFVETNHSFQTASANQRNELEALKLSKTNDESNFSLNPVKADLHSLLSRGVMGMSAVFNKVMRVETAKRATVTAIALKRYQLKHGNYPADLNALVPEFVSAVPLDPVDGQPLRYRRNADGTFLLYSVGENGVDNGGDPSLEKGVISSNYYWQNPHALDWVWPQPATAEEIQTYYEEQAKHPH